MTDITLYSVLQHLFDNRAVGINRKGESEAPLPLTNFYPHVHPRDLDVVIQAMDRLVADAAFWHRATALVGIAERSSGPLAHGLGLEHDLPYTLVNWYPPGSPGDICVAQEPGFNSAPGAPDGLVYLNGLKPGDKVIFVDDCLRTGKNALRVIKSAINAGVDVLCAVFAATVEGDHGVEAIEALGVRVHACCEVKFEGRQTKIVNYNVPNALVDPHCRKAGYGTVREIQQKSAAEMRPVFERIHAAFVGVPIYRASGKADYPYCTFSLTDFKPLLHPRLVEDMADAMVWLSKGLRSPGYVDVIVSEADRGGGPLAIAFARRCALPFTMATWEPTAFVGGDNGSIQEHANAECLATQSVHDFHCTIGELTKESADKLGNAGILASVGYSGVGHLYLNGVRRGDRCLFVDDMLSSGGTAEGVFRAIEAHGGVVAEAHFASEKTNTGGRRKLSENFGQVPLFSLCYFAAHGTETKSDDPVHHPDANPTPFQTNTLHAKA